MASDKLMESGTYPANKAFRMPGSIHGLQVGASDDAGVASCALLGSGCPNKHVSHSSEITFDMYL